MIRDITEIGVNMVKTEMIQNVQEKAEKMAEERLLDLLLPPVPKSTEPSNVEAEEQRLSTREKFRKKLQDGELANRTVEITTHEKPYILQGIVAGGEDIGMDFQNMLEKVIPPRAQARKVSVAEAKRILLQEEAEKLIDKEKSCRKPFAGRNYLVLSLLMKLIRSQGGNPHAVQTSHGRACKETCCQL